MTDDLIKTNKICFLKKRIRLNRHTHSHKYTYTQHCTQKVKVNFIIPQGETQKVGLFLQQVRVPDVVHQDDMSCFFCFRTFYHFLANELGLNASFTERIIYLNILILVQEAVFI